jgi:DNA invertase Pin-like site-specific DNA recombinase
VTTTEGDLMTTTDHANAGAIATYITALTTPPVRGAGLRAVAYLRVSTDSQGDSGLGLAAQYATIEARVAGKGWTLHAVSTDVASGKALTRRPALAEALEVLARGEADVLVCSKLDRLSRSTLDFASLLERSTREGWRVCVLDVDVDTTTPAGELTTSVLAASAQYERRLIGERTRAALAVKRAQGVTLGRPRRVTTEVADRVVALRAEGLSWRGVCATLEAEGVAPVGGGSRWYPASARRIAEGARVSA